jgi:hypothetical protein
MSQEQWVQVLATAGPIILSLIMGGWYLAKAIENVRKEALQACSSLGERIARVEARIDAHEGVLGRLMSSRTRN